MHRPDMTPTAAAAGPELRRSGTPRDPNLLAETLSRLFRLDVGIAGPTLGTAANDPGALERRQERPRIARIGTIRPVRDDARIRSIQSGHHTLKIKNQRHKTLKTFMICG